MIHKMFIAKGLERLKGFLSGARYLGNEVDFPVSLDEATYVKVGDIYIVQVDCDSDEPDDDFVEWIPVDSTKLVRHDL
jgi:hypothetical protein